MADLMLKERKRLGLKVYDLHALHYRGVQELAWHGCDDEEIAAYSGHATKSMITKYAGGAADHASTTGEGETAMNKTGPERESDTPSDTAKRHEEAKSLERFGGGYRNRTDLHGFAIRCIACLPTRRRIKSRGEIGHWARLRKGVGRLSKTL
jgi:hypothetical protein